MANTAVEYLLTCIAESVSDLPLYAWCNAYSSGL